MLFPETACISANIVHGVVFEQVTSIACPQVEDSSAADIGGH
jgi:hypothetical protein